DLKEKAVLMGSRTKYARFGAAIQCIGDINLDGFIDVAVGAPGEDGGAGSLHIYIGSPLGLSDPASQRITPSSFPFPLVGLGFAISGPQAVPGSDFPIFAASSLQNGSVVIFQSRPVVEADVTLTADPNPVDTVADCSITDIQGSCFMVELCLKGSIRGAQGATWDKKFNTTIMIDADTKTTPRKRALFRSDDGSLVESISKTGVNSETSPCTTYTAVVIESQVNRDRFRPVKVTANFELASSGSGNDLPVLDKAKQQSITIPVTFKNDCGDNEMCDVDLSVRGKLDYTGHESAWGSLVVNETKELIVDLTIKNSKETSYWTVVEIEVNSSIPYARPAAFTPSSVTCQAERETAVEKVICNYYKPLKSGEIVNIGVAFDTYLLPTDSPKVLVKATVRPQNNIASKEENPSDNSIELTTEIRIINDVTISSISTPAEVTIDHAKAISLGEKKDISKGYIVPDHDIVELNLTHKFLIQNEGPSFLLPTSIIFSVPLFLTDATLFVHEADVTISTEKDKISICKSLLSFESIDRVVTKRPQPTTTTAPPKEKETTKSNGGSGGVETTTQTSDKATTTGSEFPIVKPNRRRRRSVGSRKKRSTFDVAGNVLPNIYVQSCTLDPQYCQKFECILPKGLAPDAQAEINVTLIVDKENIPIPEDITTVVCGAGKKTIIANQWMEKREGVGERQSKEKHRARFHRRNAKNVNS
ncbi:integrin alpha 8, partial [Plakobranchus ocellatus]